jgi:kojibiose phosphorylase
MSAVSPVRRGSRNGLEAEAAGFDAIVAASAAAWEERWDDCDCTVDGDPAVTQALRFGVYHLLIAANDADPTVNIGAKSLSGEGYRGHVFWDTEVLMLPFFVYTRPDAARSLLAYRHHTLPGARGRPGRQHGPKRATRGVGGHGGGPPSSTDRANRFWTRGEELHQPTSRTA